MSIRVSIQTGLNKHHFKTEEDVFICPACGKEYVDNKYCKNCQTNHNQMIETVLTVKVHSGNIALDLDEYTCDCKFSSWFKWGNHWKEKHPYSRCKHYDWAVEEILKKVEVD